ncbi:hypothetical protein D3C72_1488920 [compost metagenome]
MAVGIVLILGLDVLGYGGVVFLGPGLAHDAQLGQLVHQHRVGYVREDIDGGRVHHFHAVDALRVDHEARGLGLRALQRKLDIIGRQWRSIAEGDAFAQGDAQLLGVDALPFGGQRWLWLLGLAVVFNQRLVHRTVHRIVDADILRMDVPRRQIGRARPAEGGRLSGQRHGRKRAGYRQCRCSPGQGRTTLQECGEIHHRFLFIHTKTKPVLWQRNRWLPTNLWLYPYGRRPPVSAGPGPG